MLKEFVLAIYVSFQLPMEHLINLAGFFVQFR